MRVFCLRLLNFLSICTLSFQVAHCFSSSDLTMHNQEMSENVHSHLQMSKRKVNFFFFWRSFYTFLTLGHIMNGALCQQPCILNLNMCVKWMTPTFLQLCNHYNLITSNNVLQLGYRTEIHVVTYYFLYGIFHLQYICCSSVGQILTYSVLLLHFALTRCTKLFPKLFYVYCYACWDQ